MVEIVWDEPKRLKNLATHGMDFADLNLPFFVAATIVPAKLGRAKAIGMIAVDSVIAVIFLRLGSQGISIISMRRASRHERHLYEQARLQAFDDYR